MTDPGAQWEGLDARVSALEHRMSMEEGLRASQDRDLSDLKLGQSAANHLLQAVSITQSEHTKKFADVLEKLGELGTKLDRHESKLDRHESKLDRHESKLDRHESKLDKLGEGQTQIFDTLRVILTRLDDLSPSSH